MYAFAALMLSLKVVAGLVVLAALLRVLRERMGWGRVTLEMTDPVTRMFNQHGLRFLASAEMRRAVRRHAPCSGMLLEMDGRTALQARMGMLADEAMCAAAQALNRTLRASDIAARLEGERFFVLLPAADEYAAEMAMERVRAGIGQDWGMAATVCATLRGDGLTIDALLAACEQKLQRAKPTRRTQISLVPQPMEMGGAQVHPSNA